MARTTATAVEEILGNNWDSSSDVDPYIESATVIVSRVNTCATSRGVSLSSAELELIERWLAAHYYTQMDPLYNRRKTSKAEGDFQDHSYLKGAYDVDYSGCLRAIIEKKKVSINWLGKAPSGQTDYVDRD